MKHSMLAKVFLLALIFVLLPLPEVLSNEVSSGSQDAGGKAQKIRDMNTSYAAPAENKSRELTEREAALDLKEQELKKMSARLDARMKELDEKRKALDSLLSANKKNVDDRYKKMLKLYKTLRPEEAAALIGKLDQETALQMLDRMDTKTAAKLVPLLDQKMVVNWTKLSLDGK